MIISLCLSFSLSFSISLSLSSVGWRYLFIAFLLFIHIHHITNDNISDNYKYIIINIIINPTIWWGLCHLKAVLPLSLSLALSPSLSLSLSLPLFPHLQWEVIKEVSGEAKVCWLLLSLPLPLPPHLQRKALLVISLPVNPRSWTLVLIQMTKFRWRSFKLLFPRAPTSHPYLLRTLKQRRSQAHLPLHLPLPLLQLPLPLISGLGLQPRWPKKSQKKRRCSRFMSQLPPSLNSKPSS